MKDKYYNREDNPKELWMNIQLKRIYQMRKYLCKSKIFKTTKNLKTKIFLQIKNLKFT